MMADKPILFSTEMVKAIIDGRKTQTRRVIKPQPTEAGLKFWSKKGFACWVDPLLICDERSDDGGPTFRVCPFGEIGTRLWVRETWKNIMHKGGRENYRYRADIPECDWNCYGPWKPSIHMPKEACRLFLGVTNIRVERLQDISENDAKKEGVSIPKHGLYNKMYGGGPYKWYFHHLWNSLNKSRGYGWDTNPWIWIIEFKVKEIE